MAMWCDPDEEDAVPGWYRATLVRMRPRARDFVMHFDDGMVESGIELPADAETVRLVDEPATDACSCTRCCADGGVGRRLPIK